MIDVGQLSSRERENFRQHNLLKINGAPSQKPLDFLFGAGDGARTRGNLLKSYRGDFSNLEESKDLISKP